MYVVVTAKVCLLSADDASSMTRRNVGVAEIAVGSRSAVQKSQSCRCRSSQRLQEEEALTWEEHINLSSRLTDDLSAAAAPCRMSSHCAYITTSGHPCGPLVARRLLRSQDMNRSLYSSLKTRNLWYDPTRCFRFFFDVKISFLKKHIL